MNGSGKGKWLRHCSLPRIPQICCWLVMSVLKYPVISGLISHIKHFIVHTLLSFHSVGRLLGLSVFPEIFGSMCLM